MPSKLALVGTSTIAWVANQSALGASQRSSFAGANLAIVGQSLDTGVYENVPCLAQSFADAVDACLMTDWLIPAPAKGRTL